MVQPETWKTIGDHAARVWVAAGPLIGVLVGAWLARSADRKKWIRDKRAEECRELLTAITKVSTMLIDAYQLAQRNIPIGDKLPTANDVYMESMQVFHTRLFIISDLEQAKLLDTWAHAVHDFHENKNFKQFDDQFDALRKVIVRIASE